MTDNELHNDRAFFRLQLVALVASFVLLIVQVRTLSLRGVYVDFGYDLQIAYEVLQGRTLYTDGFGFYSPLSSLLNAAVIKTFGITYVPSIYIYLLACLGFVILTGLLAQTIIKNINISLFASLLATLGLNCLEPYCMKEVYLGLFSVAGLIALIKGFDRQKLPLINSLAAGFFLGMATFSKQNGFLYVFAAVLWICMCFRDRIRFGSLLIFFGGTIIPWILFFLLSKSTIGNWFDASILGLSDYHTEIHQGWPLADRLTVMSMVSINSPWILFGSLILTPWLSSKILLTAGRTNQLSFELKSLIAVALFSLSQLLTYAENPSAHYLIASVPFLAVLVARYLPVFIARINNQERSELFRRSFSALIYLFMALSPFIYSFRMVLMGVENMSHTYDEEVVQVLKRLVPKNSDRVWVALNPSIYFMSETFNPTHRYGYDYTLSSQVIQKSIRENKIDVVVLSALTKNRARRLAGGLLPCGFIYAAVGDSLQADVPAPRSQGEGAIRNIMRLSGEYEAVLVRSQNGATNDLELLGLNCKM